MNARRLQPGREKVGMREGELLTWQRGQAGLHGNRLLETQGYTSSLVVSVRFNPQSLVLFWVCK